MSTFRILLCSLPLSIAGAAGFALGRASVHVHAPKSDPPDLFPSAASWCPTLELPDYKIGHGPPLPADAYAWYPKAPEGGASESWKVIPASERYYPTMGTAVILPDSRVLLPSAEAAESQPQDEADVYPKTHWLPPTATLGALSSPAWTEQGQSWQVLEPAGLNWRCYTGATILPEGSLLLTPGSSSGPSTDPSPQSVFPR